MKKTIIAYLLFLTVVLGNTNMVVHSNDGNKYEYQISEIDSITFRDDSDFLNNDSILKNAFDNQVSDIQVIADGEVIRILADDTEGDQHQKFIIRLSNNQTILIAHNIDLAPRIETLVVGDLVSIYGEYEWSSQGGTIHWTHIDPNGNHIDGWIKHDGITYQ